MKYTKSEPETIQKMFGRIAGTYDKANSYLSFSLHKYWNKQLVNSMPKQGTLLDLCSGTGDIAFKWLSGKKVPQKAILLDFCQEMLDQAKTKALPYSHHDISFIQADAQQLPLQDHSVDCATMAYGIRNIQDPAKSFREVARVLKSGGTFGILELTRPQNFFLRKGHQLYLQTILPKFGGMISSEPEAYLYLSTSIQAFVHPQELAAKLKASGFEQVKIIPLLGGIATLIVGKK